MEPCDPVACAAEAPTDAATAVVVAITAAVEMAVVASTEMVNGGGEGLEHVNCQYGWSDTTWNRSPLAMG